MPNGHEKKEYGGHSYASEGTSDCSHKCGCWMGGFQSGGPLGLDPRGDCPNNPVDGQRRNGNIDYHDVVNQRIRCLGSRAYNAEEKLKLVDPDELAIAEALETAQIFIRGQGHKIRELQKMLNKVAVDFSDI